MRAPGVGDWVMPCDCAFGEVGRADRLEGGRSLPPGRLGGYLRRHGELSCTGHRRRQGHWQGDRAPARCRRLRPLYIAGRSSSLEGCGALRSCGLRVLHCSWACSTRSAGLRCPLVWVPWTAALWVISRSLASASAPCSCPARVSGGRRVTAARRCRCCAAPWSWAWTTLTPRSTTGPASPTSSSARRCTPTRTTSRWSARSAHAVTRPGDGCPAATLISCGPASKTICAASAPGS